MYEFLAFVAVLVVGLPLANMVILLDRSHHPDLYPTTHNNRAI